MIRGPLFEKASVWGQVKLLFLMGFCNILEYIQLYGCNLSLIVRSVWFTWKIWRFGFLPTQESLRCQIWRMRGFCPLLTKRLTISSVNWCKISASVQKVSNQYHLQICHSGFPSTSHQIQHKTWDSDGQLRQGVNNVSWIYVPLFSESSFLLHAQQWWSFSDQWWEKEP